MTLEKDERILIVVTVIALIAILVARFRSVFSGVGGAPIAQTNLTYNMPSFMFAPPVANVLPNNGVVPGIATSATGGDEFMYYSDCGCY